MEDGRNDYVKREIVHFFLEEKPDIYSLCVKQELTNSNSGNTPKTTWCSQEEKPAIKTMLTLPKRDTFFTSLEPIKSEPKDQFVNCKDSKEDKSIAALREAVEAYSARKIKREEDERVQESNIFGIYESTFTDSNSK